VAPGPNDIDFGGSADPRLLLSVYVYRRQY